MIAWCPECKTGEVEVYLDENPHIDECPDCHKNWMTEQRLDWPPYEYRELGPYTAPEHFAPEPNKYAYTLENLTKMLEKVRAERWRIEYNVVDLAKLRREIQGRRQNPWVIAGKRPDGRPFYLRKLDLI